MKQHYRLTTWNLFFLITSNGNAFAQRKTIASIDSLITIEYVTGSLETISGSMEKIAETQMNKDQVTNPLEAVRGRVPGLTIQHGMDGLAALDAIRLRGTTSLTSGNGPLIIIDGIFGDLGILTSIYPTDMKSLTILKDASEATQYGPQGTSGVIEITIKKGMSGKTQVSYNGIFGISTVYKNLKILSADDLRWVASERGISILGEGNNTDFQREIEQAGLQQNHHIVFYGSSNEFSYRVSLGFIDRQGIILNEGMKNFVSNMNITQGMFDGFLNCELDTFGSVQKNHSLVDLQRTFYSTATFNPTYPNHKDPSSGSWDGVTAANQVTSPLVWVEVQDHDATSHISTHAHLTFNLMDELKLVLFGTYTYNIIENSRYLPTSVWAHGQAYKGTKKMESLLDNMILTYKKSQRKHYFDTLALAEPQRETHTGFYTTVTNFNTDKLGYHNLQAGTLRPWEGTNSYYKQPYLASLMGRFNYIYADRYSLTMTARTGASSKFGANHKWGLFPSVSAAWVIGEEKFMKRLPVTDNLKFRIDYGLVGSQSGIGSYTTLSPVKPNGMIPVRNSAAMPLGDLRNTNPGLKWEVEHTFNTGIDLAMFGNRLPLSANYCNSETTDMLYLYNISIPPFTYSTLLANIDSMRNSGLEITIGVTPLKTQDMELGISANITPQQNELLSLSGMYNGEPISATRYKSLASLDGVDFHGGYNHIVYQVVGQPLGAFYLPRADGLVSDGNGDYAHDIADLNGDGISLEDGEDRYVVGQAVPKTALGSNLSFCYRRFDISVQINGAFGHEIYNEASLTYMNMNIFPDYNVMQETPARSIKDQTATDYWLGNGTYVNFDYVTLGWNVPIEKVQKLKKCVRSLRLAFTVNSLTMVSGYSGLSPMINSLTVNSTLGLDNKHGYSLARTYTLGLSISF